MDATKDKNGWEEHGAGMYSFELPVRPTKSIEEVANEWSEKAGLGSGRSVRESNAGAGSGNGIDGTRAREPKTEKRDGALYINGIRIPTKDNP